MLRIPTTTKHALWGAHPTRTGNELIKIHTGSRRKCERVKARRARDPRWMLGIYPDGLEPDPWRG